MQPFAYLVADSAQAAIEGATGADGAAFIAGGTDLMQLMKEGAAAPRRLVDINALPCTEIQVGADGLRLGALARMSDVADHAGVRERFPVIAEALLASASAQVRNIGLDRRQPLAAHALHLLPRPGDALQQACSGHRLQRTRGQQSHARHLRLERALRGDASFRSRGGAGRPGRRGPGAGAGR
jgi:hypothetical protein